MLARRLAVGVLLVALGITGIAGTDTGDGNVTVGFGMSVGIFATTASSTAAACQLSMAPDADGVDVLDAAVSNGCINSYRTIDHRVQCVDEVYDRAHPDVFRGRPCGGSFWTGPDLEEFRAAANTESVVVYDTHIGTNPSHGRCDLV